MRMNAKQIAECTGGLFIVEPLQASELLTGISWDSREIGPGDVFVALPGERVDGHSFVASALTSGARCVIVSARPDESTLLLAKEMGASIIEVPNTYSSVTDIARWWRGQLRGRIIGLTGSTGKTTTKNLIRDVLSSSMSVVATLANQNNELGVPKTLLNADPETEAVVVEMGMRGFGHIRTLCDFVKPEWGLITNVGESHIELLGSREGIATAKSELFEALPDGSGLAFVNLADDFGETLIEMARLEERSIRVIGFDGSGLHGPAHRALADIERLGTDAPACVWAEDVEVDEEGRPCFVLCAYGFPGMTGVESAPCHLLLRGIHNVHNAAAAAAVGLACGISLPRVVQALEAALPESGRQEILTRSDGVRVINDCYNANPNSMRAALASFAAMKVEGARIAVLGDMLELGDFAEACHAGIGEICATMPLDLLITVGPLSEHIADAAQAAGMDGSAILRVSDAREALIALEHRLAAGDVVLVKASHGIGLARVVEGLMS